MDLHHSPRHRCRRLLVVLLLCFATPFGALFSSAQAGQEIEKQLVGDPDVQRCLRDGVGLDGYDPVSFHESAGPQRGRADLELDQDGIKYRFASEANRDRFLLDPKRYLPHYGGWCAMTLALGRLTCPDVLNFRIQDGLLLLFETTLHTNGRLVWEHDPDGNTKLADANYQRMMTR